MKNKNKKTNVKFFTAALIGVVVFLLNAGVVGAQAEVFSKSCYDSEIKKGECTSTVDLAKTCIDGVTKTSNSSKQTCDSALSQAKTTCKNNSYFPDECIKPATEIYKKCIAPLDLKLVDDKIKCNSDARKERIACDEKNTKDAKDNCTRVDFTTAIKLIVDATSPDSIKNCKKNILDQETPRCAKMTNASEAKECFKDTAEDAEKQCVGVCGNKVVEDPEECDDENKIDGDGCDKKCKKEGVFRVGDWLKIDEGQSYLEKSGDSDAENSTSLKKGLIYIIIQFIELLTKIIGSLALLMVIVGGLILMISSGNSQLQQKGKKIILYAILGLVVAFLSLVIVTTIQSLFYTI